jgi:CubicO group peptidase (beta-lactamase class C family)
MEPNCPSIRSRVHDESSDRDFAKGSVASRNRSSGDCDGGAGALAAPTERADAIDKLMTTLHERGQYNGAILVAEHGDVLYRRGFGKADLMTGAAFAPDTLSDIGSVTKQFTAMAIMMLAERRRLSYDDLISKYIPEFSGAPNFGRITVRQLLTHTSGIPDYGDLGIDDSGLHQSSLIAALLKKDGDVSKPGKKYRYSNAGYALLGVVVQRVTDQRLSDFLAQEIFLPCGMTNTFVYDDPAQHRRGMAVGYDMFGQVDSGGPTAVAGDGGIYSTVDDLFRWDQALKTEKLVTRSTLAEAFTPAKVEEGRSTYGFGWNVGVDGANRYVWHTGNHAGFRAFIERPARSADYRHHADQHGQQQAPGDQLGDSKYPCRPALYSAKAIWRSSALSDDS